MPDHKRNKYEYIREGLRIIYEDSNKICRRKFVKILEVMRDK
jgi:hypothetical protein